MQEAQPSRQERLLNKIEAWVAEGPALDETTATPDLQEQAAQERARKLLLVQECLATVVTEKATEAWQRFYDAQRETVGYGVLQHQLGPTGSTTPSPLPMSKTVENTVDATPASFLAPALIEPHNISPEYKPDEKLVLRAQLVDFAINQGYRRGEQFAGGIWAALESFEEKRESKPPTQEVYRNVYEQRGLIQLPVSVYKDECNRDKPAVQLQDLHDAIRVILSKGYISLIEPIIPGLGPRGVSLVAAFLNHRMQLAEPFPVKYKPGALDLEVESTPHESQFQLEQDSPYLDTIDVDETKMLLVTPSALNRFAGSIEDPTASWQKTNTIHIINAFVRVLYPDLPKYTSADYRALTKPRVIRNGLVLLDAKSGGYGRNHTGAPAWGMQAEDLVSIFKKVERKGMSVPGIGSVSRQLTAKYINAIHDSVTFVESWSQTPVRTQDEFLAMELGEMLELACRLVPNRLMTNEDIDSYSGSSLFANRRVLTLRFGSVAKFKALLSDARRQMPG